MKEPVVGVPLEAITLYSKRCVEYLIEARKKAESSVENDFRRYYEAPQLDSDVHDWSSDEAGGRAAKSSGDDESEPEDEVLVSGSTLAICPPDPTMHQNEQPKRAMKLPLNRKEKEDVIRQMGRPPYALLPLSGPDHHMVEIPNALLSKDERLSSMIVHCDAYLRIATDLAIAQKPTIVLVLRSGRFAGAIFTGSQCLHHTTSSRYTIRKKQGKAQSAQDGKRKPKSVGSQLRRAGEEALREDVKLFLRHYKTQVQSAGLVLFSCPKVMMKHLFDDNIDILPRGHDRLRKIPLDVGKPTVEAAVAVYVIMMKVNIVAKSLCNEDMARDVLRVREAYPELLRSISYKEKVEETETEKVNLVIPFTHLHELAAAANLAELIQYINSESNYEIDQQAGEDFMTPLHVAADSANQMDPTVSAACVTALLVQGRANPTILDARCRTPYFLASHAKVRDAFRTARATLGEDYCNWENAKVGPPLTLDDLQAKKDKAAEKKKRRRARQKDKNQREASEIEEIERQRKEEREHQKQQEEAKRLRDEQIRNYIQRGGTPPDLNKKPQTVQEAAHKAAHFYSMLQCDDGHWAADYGGPHFLMPGLVIAWYVIGKPSDMLNEQQIQLLQKYILLHQQSDGGWGTHLESPSTMFGSTLMYVALRLLGQPKDHPACIKGHAFLQKHGGALYTSSWSKFYLCLLGCMDWQGHNSVPPEMWLLPNWFPFHPGRMWCHARMVYLPMGYLYGHRFVYPQAETDETIVSLRKELYCEDYHSIPWMSTRHWVAPMDNYSPIPWVMKTIQNILARYEKWNIPFKQSLRQQGLEFSISYIRAEDLQTNFIDIGPVNKVLNLMSEFHATGGSLKDTKVQNHIMRIADYLWVAEDGMKMQGYNGSQCWDTSFCAQAMFEAGLLDKFPETTTKIYKYLERTQILSTEVSQDTPAYPFEANHYRQQFYRHISEGGWPFSTSAHGWPISDCTGEGLKATLCLLKSEAVQKGLQEGKLKPISDERLYKAANILLTYQNEDGGWATYENNRGWGWYEQLNPSEVFGDIMIDYSYVECSMASLTALVDFAELYPDHRSDEIQAAIDKGREFIKSIQRDDGSWYGSWACCFTYGIWFGVEGLIKCGEPLDSPCILDACQFLLKHQRPNGGWGEDFTSCYDKDYAKEGMKAYGNEGSGIVNTAWALMSLSMAHCDNVEAIRKGVQYLLERQLPSGDWPQEGISGVFNRSVGITYTAYRNVFPLWALGRCYEVYGDELDQES